MENFQGGIVRNMKTPIFFLFDTTSCNVFKTEKKYQKPPPANLLCMFLCKISPLFRHELCVDKLFHACSTNIEWHVVAQVIVDPQGKAKYINIHVISLKMLSFLLSNIKTIASVWHEKCSDICPRHYLFTVKQFTVSIARRKL